MDSRKQNDRLCARMCACARSRTVSAGYTSSIACERVIMRIIASTYYHLLTIVRGE